jgi:tetratricopeptide (TPR) repeat protein
MSRLRRAEAICEAIAGSESVELLGEVLHGLAWAAKAACEASTAVEATFVKAKSVQSGLPLATTLDSLANHLMAGAQWDAARECLNQCVKIRSHQLMKYHPDNAAVHVSLGRWNQLQHLYAEAFAEFEQAAHIYAHAVGAWHVRAANAYHFLAEVLLLLPPSTRTLLEACRCSRLAVHIRCTHYAHDTVQVTKSVDVSKRAQCALLELLVKEVRSNVSALCLDDVTQDSELDGDALYEAATTIDFALRNGTQSTKGSVETENCARGRAVASCQKVADSPTHAGRSRGQPNETSSCALASSIGTEDPPVNQPATWDPNTCAISGLFSHGQRTAARFTRHIAARVEARLLDGLARAEAEQCSLEEQLLKSELQTLRYQLVAACLAKYRAAACISNKANLGPARSTSFVCVSESRDLTELDLDSKIQLAEWAIESFGQQRESLSPILSLTPFYESSGSNLSPITTVT